MTDTRFKVTIEIEGESTDYYIPTGYNDVTIGNLIEIQTKYENVNPESILRWTGIPIDLLMVHEVERLTDLCTFVYHETYSRNPPNVPEIDMENEPFIKWSNMVQMMQGKKSRLWIAECVFNVYLGQSILDDRANDILPVAMKLIQQVETIFQKYPKTEIPPSKYAAKAGVHRIERFGMFATVFELANGNLTEFEKIMERPTHFILQTLSYVSLKANINHKINETT